MGYDYQTSDSARKRGADDAGLDFSDAVNGIPSFNEHRNKRLHSLPLRTSPTQKRWSGPPSFPVTQVPPATITPTDSDSEEVHGQQSWHNPPSMDVDRDMDMMVDSQPAEHLEPGPSQRDHIATSITGRMPTPIHCTFAAQVRGNKWGNVNHAMHSANQTVKAGIQENTVETTHVHPFPLRQDSSVPRSLDDVPEWTMVQNRRLPSPISENGGEEMPASPGMILDSSSQLQRPYLPHMPHSTNPHAMAIHPNIRTSPPPADADAAMMDTDTSSPSSAPATPSPRSKFGHSRSKHTVNNWTLQPGMKKSFSIGYRADCEKCRLKIPGHFNHIIVS
ncbi:hypothetical protein F5Y15DRAFT_28564 [Xylariaceae sp. FL0016]|nr:hypothetical protein F5Y15DRAFT_28564 [Xylariaceae sp. FL0016]